MNLKNNTLENYQMTDIYNQLYLNHNWFVFVVFDRFICNLAGLLINHIFLI